MHKEKKIKIGLTLVDVAVLSPGCCCEIRSLHSFTVARKSRFVCCTRTHALLPWQLLESVCCLVGSSGVIARSKMKN